MRYREAPSVRDYGARGVGTDDTEAIELAIATVASQRGGELFWPLGTYRFTRPLKVPEYVSFRGETVESTPHAEGVKLIFDPSEPCPEPAITFEPSPSFPLSYITPSVSTLGLSGGSNAHGAGFRFVNCRGWVNQLDIREFYQGPGLDIEGAINSLYQQVLVSHCDLGLRLGSGMLSTTVTFGSCYFTHCRQGAELSNANTVRFTDWTVFETTQEHGVIANDIEVLDLDSCYWENVAQSLVRVGEVGRVDTLKIQGGHAVTGVGNDPSWDAIYVGENRLADVSLVSCIIPKASFVHMGESSGQLIVIDPNYQSTPKYIAEGEQQITQLGRHGSIKSMLGVSEVQLAAYGGVWRLYTSFTWDPGDLHLVSGDGGHLLYARQDGRWAVGGNELASQGGRLNGPVEIDGLDILGPVSDNEVKIRVNGVEAWLPVRFGS